MADWYVVCSNAMNSMIVLVGFLAGLLCSLGGALKDSPHEGFSWLKFPRSALVGAFWGFVLMVSHVGFRLAVAFCVCGYLERVTVEGWKILRAQRPSKFDLTTPEELGKSLGFRKLSHR